MVFDKHANTTTPLRQILVNNSGLNGIPTFYKTRASVTILCIQFLKSQRQKTGGNTMTTPRNSLRSISCNKFSRTSGLWAIFRISANIIPEIQSLGIDWVKMVCYFYKQQFDYGNDITPTPTNPKAD